MSHAGSYAEWQESAAEHDRLSGAADWREDDQCEWIHASELRASIARLRRMRRRGETWTLMNAFQDALFRHQGECAQPELYQVARAGTKRVIGEYLEELETCFAYLLDLQAPGVDDAYRLAQVKRVGRVYGRPALMLSGGALLGLFHFGVVKALFENERAESREMYHSLARALYRLEHDPELRVGVIWAEGPHFTSGVDLNDWADAFASGSPFPIEDGEIDPFSLSGPRLSKPLVIAVQGRCYTWGWELLLNTDLRVASSDTRFAMLEVRRGIYACGGATLRLRLEIGGANAQRYLHTGDELGAEDAYRLGLVQQLCEPGEQLQCALALAQHVAQAAPLGVQGSLRSSRTRILKGEAAAVEPMFRGIAEVMRSEDAAEGVRSFIERRDAVFRGR